MPSFTLKPTGLDDNNMVHPSYAVNKEGHSLPEFIVPARLRFLSIRQVRCLTNSHEINWLITPLVSAEEVK